MKKLNFSYLGEQILLLEFKKDGIPAFLNKKEMDYDSPEILVSSQYKNCELKLYSVKLGLVNIPLTNETESALDLISQYIFTSGKDVSDFYHFLIYSEKGIIIYRLTNKIRSYIQTSQDWLEYKPKN